VTNRGFIARPCGAPARVAVDAQVLPSAWNEARLRITSKNVRPPSSPSSELIILRLDRVRPPRNAPEAMRVIAQPHAPRPD
jgi:hypothetical protein